VPSQKVCVVAALTQKLRTNRFVFKTLQNRLGGFIVPVGRVN
jgi:hypothetical protein